MRLYFILAAVFLLPLVPKWVFACADLVGDYQCEKISAKEDLEKIQLEIFKEEHFAVKQSRLGIGIGPLYLDNTERTSVDSQNISMQYIGRCLHQSALSIDIRQSYFGGLRVRFQHEIFVSEDGLELKITNYKVNSQPESHSYFCQ